MCSLAFYFHTIQKNRLQESNAAHHNYKKEQQSLEKNLDFLRENHKEISYLNKHEIFKSKSRLIVSEAINQCASSLNGIRFQFEPEATKCIENSYCFKVSNIVIETSSFLDTDIFDFLINVSKTFPEVFLLRKLSIRRNKQPSDVLSLKREELLNCTVGEIRYEWFSVAEEKYED